MIPPPSPQQPDPSVLIQYHNVSHQNNREDRRLISTPYCIPQQQRQHQQQVLDVFTSPSNHSTDIGPYGCGVTGCFASFSASNGLFAHMKEVHKNTAEIYKPYRCAMPTCPKRYKNINGLQYHLREAKGSSGHGHVASNEKNTHLRPYQCQISGCKKAYRTANGLQYHHLHGHVKGPPLQHIVNTLQEQQYQLRMQQHQQGASLQSIQAHNRYAEAQNQTQAQQRTGYHTWEQTE
jgi:hypothetical protein